MSVKKIIFIILFICITMPMAFAQKAYDGLNVDFTDTYSSFRYQGKITLGTEIHAVYSGKITNTLSKADIEKAHQQFVKDNDLQSSFQIKKTNVLLSVKDSDGKTVANKTFDGTSYQDIAETFAITNSKTDTVFTYTIVAENIIDVVCDDQTERKDTFQINADKTIVLYPQVQLPSIKGGFKKLQYLENETQTVNLAVEESEISTGKGKSSLQWLKDNDAVSGKTTNEFIETTTISFEGKEKASEKHSYSLEYKKFAPDDNTIWALDTIEVASLTVYNVPQISSGTLCKLSFEYEDTKSTEYFLINTGLSNADLLSNQYMIVFGDNAPQSSRYYKPDGKSEAPTKAYLAWVYDDGFISKAKEAGYSDQNSISINLSEQSTKMGLGTLEEDARYSGSVESKDEHFGLLGSDIINSIKVSITDPANIAKAPVCQLINGNTVSDLVLDECKLSHTFQPEAKGRYETKFKISLPIMVEKDEEKSFVFSANNQAVNILAVPKLPTFDNTIHKSRDIDTCTIAYKANATGANVERWNYEWLRNDTLAGKSSLLNLALKKEINSAEMATAEDFIRVRCYNIAPDDKTVWFADTVNVASVRFYNTPEKAESIECLKTETSVVYAATGFDASDEVLSYRKYQFVFSGGAPQPSRYLTNPEYAPKDVKTLWKYEDFDCYSDATIYDKSKETNPSIKAHVLIDKGIHEKDGNYKGAVSTQDGKAHALVGSDVKYVIEVDTKGGQLISGSVNYGEVKVPAEVDSVKSTLTTMLRIEDKVGANDKITVDAIIRYIIEPSAQIKDLETTFTVPQKNTFVLYPIPTYPVQVNGYANQFAYSEERTEEQNKMNIKMSVAPGKGGNNNWKYNWSSETAGIVSNDTILKDKVLCNPSVAGAVKKTNTDNIRLRYSDIAPDGSAWIEGYIDYPIMIYNVPSCPAKFQKKGTDNASHFYIASMDVKKFGEDGVDDILKQREYFFVYGNADSIVLIKDAVDVHLRARWCDYTKYDKTDPWVQTMWKYKATESYPEYTAYSSRCYMNNGGRGGITAIEAIDEEEVTVLGIYTLTGNLMPQTDITELPNGIYIIVKKQGGEVKRIKLLVR